MTNAFTNHVPLQILTKLAPELLQLIISFLSIFDIEALRSVNRNLKGKIPVGYLNQLKHREEVKTKKALQRNRRNLIWITGNLKRLLKEKCFERTRLIQLLLKNEELCETLSHLRGRFDETRLEQYGMRRYSFRYVHQIGGQENFWNIDIPGKAMAILLIPREVTHRNYCKKHESYHSTMIIEAVMHQWEHPIGYTLEMCDNQPFRESRFITLTDDKKEIENIMYEMGLFDRGFNMSWKNWNREMWLPPTDCLWDFQHTCAACH